MQADGPKSWFSASELAGLPGMSGTKRGVNLCARTSNWERRERQGRGGGREFALASLPAVTRAHILAEQAKLATRQVATVQGLRTVEATPGALQSRGSVAAEIDAEAEAEERERKAIAKARAAGLVRFGRCKPRQKRRAQAKLAVLAACEEFRKANSLLRHRGEEAFVMALRAGDVPFPGEAEGLLKPSRIHVQTLRVWFRRYDSMGIFGLVDHRGSRQGTGRVDVEGPLNAAVLALMSRHPNINPVRVQEFLKAEHPDLPVVSTDTLRRFMVRWKADHAQLWSNIVNPDGFESRFKTAFGNASASIVSANELWEMDSTPGDVMLADGRHSILGVIDCYTRRVKLLVSKTSKATMVASLIRKAIIAWGVPEAIRSDNGADYRSAHVARVLGGLSVRQVFCAPFQHRQKPFIERALGTFSHDLVEVLDGFIGHSVAERKEIESRVTFARRIMERDAVVPIRYSSAEFQRICDDWTDKRYGHQVHSTTGKTPFAMAQECQAAIRTIPDERALDMLLFEAPGDGGFRMIRRDGIHFDNATFCDRDGLLGEYIGKRALIRIDPDDLGRIWVFPEAPDGSTFFLCLAECPERVGTSRVAYALAMDRRQRAYLNAQRKALRQFKREIRGVDVGLAILEADKQRAEEIRVEPQAAERYSTPALEAAAAAAEVRQATPRVRRMVVIDGAGNDGPPAAFTPVGVPAQPRSKYADSEEMDRRYERLMFKKDLTPEEIEWMRLFEDSPAGRSLLKMHKDFGPPKAAVG